MDKKKTFQIAFGYEELVSLEDYQNFKIKVDIAGMTTTEEAYEKDFSELQKKVFTQIDKQREKAFKRIEFQKEEKRLTSILNGIIDIFNEERSLTDSDKRGIKKQYNKAIEIFRQLKTSSKDLIEKNEKIEQLSKHIKYMEGVIKNEFNR